MLNFAISKVHIMKNLVLVASVLFLALLSGCSKKDACDPSAGISVAPASEVEILHQYILNNKIEADKDERGFFYKIQTTGTGNHPDPCSKVKVNYKGQLTNGTVFDEANDIDLKLSGVIDGWKAGLPLIGEGGKIILYIPPSLNYGSNTPKSIPPNSILIFSIDLVKVY
jgi:FKBP-type peptidyl-prolyl cis-trans isomerase FkpA